MTLRNYKQVHIRYSFTAKMSLPTKYEYDEKKQRNLQQFHKEFKDQLPMLVIVTEGSYGETKYDDFSNDQVRNIGELYQCQW